MYDETPLKLRQQKDDKNAAEHSERRHHILKVMQCEFALAITLREVSSGKVVMLRLPVPTHLSELDRATGENTKGAVQAQVLVAEVNLFIGICPHVFSVMTGDRASSNDCAEDGFYFSAPNIPRLRLTCAPHCISTAQGRAYGAVALDMSGQIAASLVQSMNSHILREEIENVLLASVHPTDIMPNRHGEAAAYRKAILDLCIPSCDNTSIKRRASLEVLLPGDFCSDVILWYVPNLQHCNVGLWAKKVARLLFPGRIPPIPRQRWANSLASQCEYTLLANVHNILGRAGPRWLSRISGETVQAPRKLSAVLDGATQSSRREPFGWDFDSDAELEPQQDALPLVEQLDPHVLEHATGAAAEQAAVKEFNQKQKGRARAFICSDPQHRLVIATLCLGVAVTFLHSVEHVASQQWETRGWNKCIKDPLAPPPSRMVEAAKGTIAVNARKKAEGLLLDGDRWRALSPPGRTFGSAGLGFSMLSTFMCSIDQILLRFWHSWPYRIYCFALRCFSRLRSIWFPLRYVRWTSSQNGFGVCFQLSSGFRAWIARRS